MFVRLYVYCAKVGNRHKVQFPPSSNYQSKVIPFPFRTESSCFSSCDGQEWQGNENICY